MQTKNNITQNSSFYEKLCCHDINFQSCIQGSKYFPVMAAITLQRELQTKEVIMVWENSDGVDGNNNQLPDQISLCKNIWPSDLYTLQKNNSHGSYIASV